MSWLSSFLHPGRGYQKAQEELNKYYGQVGKAQDLAAKGQEQLDKYYNQAGNYYGQAGDYYNQAQGYQQPFLNQGQSAYGNLSGVMNSLLNPQALQDKWSLGYKASDAAKNLEAMAQEHGLNAASSMGLMGSNTALGAIQAGTSAIGAQDRQNYLNDLMQKYLEGTGIAQGLYGTGINAANNMSGNALNMGQNAMNMGQNAMNMGQNSALNTSQNAINMGQNAMNMGQNSAQMAYNKQNAGGNILGNLLGAGIGLAGSSFLGGRYNNMANRWNLGGR